MMLLTAFVATSMATLFRPAPSCDGNPAHAVLRNWNHFFPTALHNVPVDCHALVGASIQALPDGAGIVLDCNSTVSCDAVIAAYVAPASAGQALLAKLEAASQVLGATHLGCTTTSDCNHPAAVCDLSNALNGMGYCVPGPMVAPSKRTCYSGLHASCDELIVASIGIGAGILGWAIYSLIDRPRRKQATADTVTAMNVLEVVDTRKIQ